MSSAALKFGAIVVAGLGLNDLKNFVKENTAAGNAAFYMAKNIGVSVESLSRWQNLIKLTGGDASQAESSLLGISNALATIQINGRGGGELLGAFRVLGVDITDPITHKLKDVSQITEEVRKGLLRLAKLDPRLAYQQAHTLGYGDDFIRVLLKSEEEYKKLNEQVDKSGVLTKEQAEAARDLTTAWANLSNFLTQVGNDLLGKTDPALSATLNIITSLSEALYHIGAAYEHSRLSDIGTALGTVMGYLIPGAGPLSSLLLGEVGGRLGKLENDKVNGGKADSWINGIKDWKIPDVSGKVDTWSKEFHSWLNSPAGISNVKPTPSAPLPVTVVPSTGSSFSDKVYDIISKIEGGKAGTITPTKDPLNPFVYGKNQISLGAALSVDATATKEKLLDPVKNDEYARKIEARLIKKYGTDLDAIYIAYHNGEAAADSFVKLGSTTGIKNWGPQSQQALERERAYASNYKGGDTNTASTTIHGGFNINAPQATDLKGILAEAKRQSDNFQFTNGINSATF